MSARRTPSTKRSHLGYLLGRSPQGGWFEIEPGNWQHFKEPPTVEEIEAERTWLRQREEQLAKGKPQCKK